MAFTTGTLAAFIVTTLGATGVALGLTVASDAVVDAVAEIEAVVGVATASMTDDLKTRTVARWIAWRTALGAAAGYSHIKAGTSELWRSEVFDHIRLMLTDAETAALRYDEVAAVLAGGNTAYVSGISTSGSPYAYRACPEYG